MDAAEIFVWIEGHIMMYTVMLYTQEHDDKKQPTGM